MDSSTNPQPQSFQPNISINDQKQTTQQLQDQKPFQNSVANDNSKVKQQLEGQQEIKNQNEGLPNGQFDEVPIGKATNTFQMTEFPDGTQEIVIDTNVSMKQKLKSKVPKLKLLGLQQLKELLENDADDQKVNEINIGKLLQQTNPACLQKVLNCLKIWIQKGKKIGQEQIRNCIQFGYINGKQNTKKLSFEIIDQIYQKQPDIIETTIVEGLKGKVPKILAGYIAIINELLNIYGIKRLKFLKPYFPDLVIVINRQKLVAVKNEGMILIKQSLKWMTKEVVDPFIKNLKQGLRKEVQVFWDEYDKTQVMTAPKDIVNQNSALESKKVDAYELSEAVDIFKKFNQKWSEKVIKQEKWNEKVKMMTEFVNAANVPKLSNSDSRHISEMIRRLINHSNFNVVLWDIKIMAVLAKGLRKFFAPIAKSQFLNVIQKFREKRKQMIEEINNTLNQFYYCISIQDVLDDVKKGLGDKSPEMKTHLLTWIVSFIQKKQKQKGELPEKLKDALKSLFPVFQKLLIDSVSEVRDLMGESIVQMKGLLGDDFFANLNKKGGKPMAQKSEENKKQVGSTKTQKQRGRRNSEAVSKVGVKKENEEKPQNKPPINNVKSDFSNEIQDLIPLMNHSDPQKRKQAVEAISTLIKSNPKQKIQTDVLSDLILTLQKRVSDPSKNIVKYFIQLAALMFQVMNDRDIKVHGRNFICSLIDGFADKVEANRKQTSIALNRIGQIYGKDQVLSILGGYLDNQKQSRLEILKFILQNEQYLMKADIREYPKGIIRCLIDKNKQIRNLSQNLFEITYEKIGISVYKELVKKQKPAVAKDLTTLFAKYDKGGLKTSKSSVTLFQKATTQKKLNPSMTGSFIKKNEVIVQGNQTFAPLKTLTSQRILRQQKQQKSPWICNKYVSSHEQSLQQSIQALFNSEIAKKMFSIDYPKVLEAQSQLSNLLKNTAYENEFRQIYDLIFKWVLSRIWGGNPAAMNIIEILPEIMVILDKKKLTISDGEIDIIIAILRQSFICGFMNENKVSDKLLLITKMMITLSSGDRVLKKLLKQFATNLSLIHKHIRNQAIVFYHIGIRELIKKELMEYVGNGGTLEEVSKIKQLKNDGEFVELLYQRFHQKVLDGFGFKFQIQSSSLIDARLQKLSPESINISNNTDQVPNNYQTPKKITNPLLIDELSEKKINKVHGKKLAHQNVQASDLSKYSKSSLTNPDRFGKILDNFSTNQSSYNSLNKMLLQNQQKKEQSLAANSNLIFAKILQNTQQLMNKRNQTPPEQIIKHFILLQSSIKCKSIISNIHHQLLLDGIQFSLSQLVKEDEQKSQIVQSLASRNLNFKPEEFVVAINSTLLRFLQKTQFIDIINILFIMLNQQLVKQTISNKTVSLIIRCLTKAFINQNRLLSANKIKLFFMTVIKCLDIFEIDFELAEFKPCPEQKLSTDQSVVKIIKQVIDILARQNGTKIWVHYENAIQSSTVQDKYIKPYIQSLKIQKSKSIEENKALKKVTDLLSQNKTFETGIIELKKYINLNPSFAPNQYFSNRGFDNHFIASVINALQGSRVRKTPTKRQMRQQRSQNSRVITESSTSKTNIEDTINILTMRLNDGSSQKKEETSSPITPKVDSKKEIIGEEKANQVKRRINEIKNRMMNNEKNRSE